MKRLAWLLIGIAACGGDDRVDDFIGTWTYLAGSSATTDCDDNQFDSTEAQTGMFQFAAGTSSDLVEVAAADDVCPSLRLDVSGGTAKVQAGQSCTETLGTSTVMIAVDKYTGTLDSAGTKMTLAGQATMKITGAATVTCTITFAGSAMKAAARIADGPRTTWTDALVRRLR